MASYKFQCCGEGLFLNEEQHPSVFVEHACGGIPCMALAVSTASGDPVLTEIENDIASPELDAALDLVAGGTEDVSLVPVVDTAVDSAPVVVTVDTPAPTE